MTLTGLSGRTVFKSAQCDGETPQEHQDKRSHLPMERDPTGSSRALG